MLNVRLAGDYLIGKMAVHLAVAGDVYNSVFLCCTFFPRDVLYEIRDSFESVSEGFSTYLYLRLLQKSNNNPGSHLS